MKAEQTSARLNKIMIDRKLKQVDILEKARPFCEQYGIKLGRNDLSQYVSGKVEPGQEKLTVLGMALNVSEAWLMGYDVPMDRKMPTPVSESGHSDDELISLWKSLTPDEILRVKDFVQGMIASRKEPLAHKD